MTLIKMLFAPIFTPLFIIYWTAWYLIAGRKGHGDIILYHDGIEIF